MKRFYIFVLAAILFCSFRIVTPALPVIPIAIGTVTMLRPDTIILPDSYKNRHFLNNSDAATSDLASIPGNVARYTTSASTGYEIATLKAMIKGNKPTVAQNISDGLITQGQIAPESSINGSDMVAGLIAEKGKVIDMEIRDASTYAVPDGQIDTAALKSALQSVSAGDRKNLFYIISATVSVITYKVHAAPSAIDKVNKKADKVNKKLDDLSKNDTAKNGVYLKVKQPKPKTPPASFSDSDTKTFTEKTLSVQLIPVDALINATEKK